MIRTVIGTERNVLGKERRKEDNVKGNKRNTERKGKDKKENVKERNDELGRRKEM
jgi:hypothetical protein